MAAMSEFQKAVENDARPSIDHDNMGLDIKMKSKSELHTEIQDK